ncbi:hypothetical protein [Leifsonia sp. EB34]|uniref:hypothetical protein n=1 Tax=Leifsonia sp. EB34 TaxID=3156303 RepID=UPI003518CEF9
MSLSWTAGNVRARGLVRGRAGSAVLRQCAQAAALPDALALLGGSAYASRLAPTMDLVAAQRAIADTLLWQIRVLAGWLPPGGTRIAVAAAAVFERANILARARLLADGGHEPASPFELGTLGTAWPTIRATTSLADLHSALRASPWGDAAAAQSTTALDDLLSASLLRRIAACAPLARDWCVVACTLIATRVSLLERAGPDQTFRRLVAPLIGDRWSATNSLAALRDAAPRPARTILAGIDRPEELWRGQVALAALVDAQARRSLTGGDHQADSVVAALAILFVDAWRARAALAACESGRREVFDVVA